MKISEMTNEQAAQALIRIAGPFENICKDEAAMQLLNDYKGMGDKPMIQTIGEMLPKICLYLFKEHKADLFEIVGALTMQTVKQVAGMNFFATIKAMQDSYDEVLKAFFTSSAGQMNGSAGA